MPRTDTPEGPPVQKKIPKRGPSKETLELGQTCLNLIAKGVERHLLAERLHVTRKRVDHALRTMRQQAAAAAGEEPPRRASRIVPPKPLDVPGGWRWQEDAACWGEPISLFFGPDGELAAERHQREQEAKAVCDGCSVRTECLDFSIGGGLSAASWQKYGLWGNLTQDERAAERRKRMKRASNGRIKDRAKQEQSGEEETAA